MKKPRDKKLNHIERVQMNVIRYKNENKHAIVYSDGYVVETSTSKHKMKHRAIGFNIYLTHYIRSAQQMVNRGANTGYNQATF